MKICAVADLHGNLPEIPQCDLLVIAGDFCPNYSFDEFKHQQNWLNTCFRDWLHSTPNKETILVAGNHDRIFEAWSRFTPLSTPDFNLPCTYLQDSGCWFDGYYIWGTPWQPAFGVGWAFNRTEYGLEQEFAKIPEHTEILVSHGPPFGYGDTVPTRITDENEEEWPTPSHHGSHALLERIVALPKLRLVICGHIHPGYGIHAMEGDVLVINAALLNDAYQLVNNPIVWSV